MDSTGQDTVRGGALGVFAFAFGEVVVEAANPHRLPGNTAAFTYWPCPGCDRRQLLDDVWMVTVSDPPGDRNRREVMICAGCAAGLSRRTDGSSPTT